MLSRFLKNPLSEYASIMSDEFTGPRVGKVTDDRTAVIGRDAWLFIYEGGNQYKTAYMEPDQYGLGESWASLIEMRQRKADSLGIQILHLVIPNKLTLLPQYFPEKLNSSISYALSSLIFANCDADLLIPINELRNPDVSGSVFRRNDSHFTIAGNACVTDIVLSRLGMSNINIENSIVPTSVVKQVGDLGIKFPKKIGEHLHAPDFKNGFLDQSKIHKIKELINPPRHLGSQVSFRNNNAPIDKKIVVYGNSFFSMCPSWGMSPFFAALFKEFHFIWSYEVDFDQCKDIGADIVLFQTCERFLSRVPAR
ncbi:hypothetical protein [Pseudomonas juntendi]|uniref:hypothetical protein n=1 Tax=Pseudomonas juntendi TaxID=2666183 RepID=UPI00137AA628|nr:hypothetical protein [Pseudomonas juntendi]